MTPKRGRRNPKSQEFRTQLKDLSPEPKPATSSPSGEKVATSTASTLTTPTTQPTQPAPAAAAGAEKEKGP
ncbi:MAG: hypothetical protein ABSD92_09710 [Candidatus Bathyarchaeia archaeon]